MLLWFRFHPAKICTLLAACTSPLLMPLQIPAQVHGPRLVSERTPDLHDLDRFVSSVVRPGMTQKEQAMALWRAYSRQM